MGLLRTTDIKAVQVIVNGVPMSGFAAGDAVVVEPEGEEWTMHFGADGDPTRVKQNKPGGKITIRLAATSLLNNVLDGFADLDNASRALPVAILVLDTLSGTSAFCPQATLEQKPGVTFGSDLQEKEWVYLCGSLTLKHQGSLF
jgi:hypothetical protein